MAFVIDREMLEAALIGLQQEKARIDAKMADIQRLLGRSRAFPTSAPAAPRKRVLSAAARKRIAEAQRKRWAAFRKAQKPTSASTKRSKDAG